MEIAFPVKLQNKVYLWEYTIFDYYLSYNLMKIVIAPDKFKDALSAREVCKYIEKGINKLDPCIETVLFPVSDGGEGISELLTHHTGGKMVETEVTGPLFQRVTAAYGISGDGKTAYMEMSQASGLQLIPDDKRNCMKTTTAGTGEMILDVYNKGVRRIILGIGGSATNDAGIGMASALGYSILDAEGNLLEPVGENLEKIKSIEPGDLKINTDELEVLVACDVSNPLYGKDGAAYVYAPQKGANPRDVEKLDEGLRNFARVAFDFIGNNISDIPGAGAAGGLGAGCIVFLKAELKNGIGLFLNESRFSEAIEGSHLVITGEGKIDSQTVHGKAVQGVCRVAGEKTIPVAALCGKAEIETSDLEKLGLAFIASVSKGPLSLEESLKQTGTNLEFAAYNLVKIFRVHDVSDNAGSNQTSSG